MYSHFRTALSEIVSRLKDKYPDNLAAVYAFGSRVRGDHTSESDFDILVVVNDRTIEVEEGIIDVFVEEETKSGIAFDPVIKTAESFAMERRYSTPFYRNITRQGIQL